MQFTITDFRAGMRILFQSERRKEIEEAKVRAIDRRLELLLIIDKFSDTYLITHERVKEILSDTKKDDPNQSFKRARYNATLI